MEKKQNKNQKVKLSVNTRWRLLYTIQRPINSLVTLAPAALNGVFKEGLNANNMALCHPFKKFSPK